MKFLSLENYRMYSTYVCVNFVVLAFLQNFYYLSMYIHTTYIHMCIEFFGPHSLPDPVPLEKDNPIRTDVPTPVLDNYITVSYTYITVCKRK